MDPYSRHLSSFKSHQAWLSGGKAPALVNGQPTTPATCIVFGGQAYPIVAGSVEVKKKLGAGGFSMDADLVFTMSNDVFGDSAAPTQKQLIVYLNKAYRIDSIRTLAGGVLQRYECNDPDTDA